MIRLLWDGFIKGISLCLSICVYVAICVIRVYQSILTQKISLALTSDC